MAEGRDTPLFAAINTNKPRLELIELLLQKDANPDCHKTGKKTPLYLAVSAYLKNWSKEHRAIVTMLLKYQANPDCHSKGENTPLYLAVKYKNIDLVSELLKAGADVNANDPGGDTALKAASQHLAINYSATTNGDLYRIFKELLKYKPDAPYEACHWPAVISATLSAKKAPDLLHAYIKKGGINPDWHTGSDHLLYQAIDHGYPIPYLKQLLKAYDLDLNSYSEQSTPLCIAAILGNVGSLKLLLKKGADPNASSYGPWTPLFIGVRRNHLESVKLLLRFGANPNTAAGTDRNPLIEALRCDYREKIAAALLRHGACTKPNPSMNKESLERIQSLIKKYNIPPKSIDSYRPPNKKKAIWLYRPHQKITAVDIRHIEPKFNTHTQNIAIIGGGASGIMSAIYALRASAIFSKPIRVTLYEQRDKGFGGLAYSHSTSQSAHSLNLAPWRVSIFSDHPESFINFLSDHRKNPSEQTLRSGITS